MPTLIVALLAQAAASFAPSPITVHVTNVRDSAGTVRVELCTEQTFLHGGCEPTVTVPAVAGETVVVVPDVPPGVYAVQVYHDRNSNKTVDRGTLGIPKEDVGFSRQAPLGVHGPSFPRAAFTHDEAQSITVRLRRFL